MFFSNIKFVFRNIKFYMDFIGIFVGLPFCSLCHETRAIALAHAHTHAKPFRSAKNRAREELNTHYFFVTQLVVYYYKSKNELPYFTMSAS